MLLLSALFLDHLRHPRNTGVLDPARLDVGTGAALGEVCRDRVRLQIHVTGGTISEARYQVFGCAGMLAVASWSTEVFRGVDIEEARALMGSGWAAGLELPADKRHCVALLEDALGRAIDDLEAKRGRWGKPHPTN